MNRSWRFFGEAKRRQVPTQEGMPLSCKWGYLWIVPIRSLPAAMRFCQRGPRPVFWQGAALQSDGLLSLMDEIRLEFGGLLSFGVTEGGMQ